MVQPKAASFIALSLVTITAITAAAAPHSSASGAMTDLGSPTDTQTTAAYFPLSGFHHVSTFLRQSGKPELLMLGAQGGYARIDVERWPVVKALSQFGRLSGVQPVDSACTP